MTTEYRRPTDAELPAALAKEMGWETEWCGDFYAGRRPWWKDTKRAYPWIEAHEDWKPLTDRNHSRLAVERCSVLGLLSDYKENLIETLAHDGIEDPDDLDLIMATPAQESHAAYKTLREHNLDAAR